MPERLAQRILTHVTRPRYTPVSAEALANELELTPTDRKALQTAVDQLVSDGHVVLSADDAIALPPPGRTLTGVFRANERGFGFLLPDQLVQHGDLFIPPHSTMGAMTGDRVVARVRHEPGRARSSGKSPYTGQIIEILQRADRRYTGTLVQRGKTYIVEADGRSFSDPVVVRDPSTKNARPGDKVVLELISYPERDTLAEGVIVEVLGEAGQPDVETQAVIHAFGLEEGFDEATNAEARAAAATLSDTTIPEDRLDLTETFICTIDPPDAKDFDDAISITKFDQPDEEGAVWELGVHIADVAHFVKPDSALDTTAKRRGNSTYLPRRVLPMLPELLSNGVCSLQPNVVRFAKSCFIRYSAKGKVVGARFARAAIKSAHRLTYLEAQALIDGDIREAAKHCRQDSGGETKYPRQLIQTLKHMDDLAKTIRQRRMNAGMIVLGLPEVELVFDDAGRVVDAEPEDNAFTHTIIEMFMVEANEAAARLFNHLRLPMIRRVHADPETSDTDELRGFARVAGFNIPKNPTRLELQQLLEHTRGKPAEHAVHLAVLKTLTRAEYSPALIGHFALASEHYTHFTSPIRRYPDLVVHRGLDTYLGLTDNGVRVKQPIKKLAGKIEKAPGFFDEQAQRDLGLHCSQTERNSAEAEKELRQYLILELLEQHVGDDFPGTCTGVMGRGIFVQIDKYLVDGFIGIRDLPGGPSDRWKLNDRTGALVAQGSGRSLSIGQRFTVRVAKVDLARRQLDLVIVDGLNQKPGQGSGKVKPSQSRPNKHKTHKGKPSYKTGDQNNSKKTTKKKPRPDRKRHKKDHRKKR